jgi:O-antigen/teichoic acid export membrane protein
MLRLLALGSYFYQSLVAILLILALSHLLEPASYTTYSLTVAVSQLAAVVAFEWLQLAGQRFLSSSQGDETPRLQSSLFNALALSIAALIAVAALVSLSGSVPRSLIGITLAVTIMQGTVDLHYMMIRVSGRLSSASVLMISRATFVLVGATIGAKLHGTAEAALVGILAGHGLGLALGSLVDRTLLNWSPQLARKADLSAFARYGMLASGASVVHLSAPILIRFMIVGRFGVSSSASAGFSMAIDLLQRPFSVLLSAIHTISYPDVVLRYDTGTRKEAQQAAAELFELAFCSTALMLGGLIAFIPDAARLFVPPALIASFLAATPSVAVFYFLHTHLQATLALVPHLQKAALRLILIAAGQLALISAFVMASSLASAAPTTALAGAALATALVMLAACGPTVRFAAYPRPSLVLFTAVGSAIIGGLAALPSEPLLWLVGKILVAAAVTLAIVWFGDFLRHDRA